MNKLKDLFHDEQYIFASILTPVSVIILLYFLFTPYHKYLSSNNPICNNQDVSASISTQAPVINTICNDQDVSASTSTQASFPKVITDSNSFNNESNGPDDPSDSVELISGLTFPNWKEFKIWLNGFALKNGFSYKVKTSEITNGVMKRATYECTKSGLHAPQVTSDPTKRHNIYSQRIQCQ
ncbi:34230_t:CDS:2 [Racocetra persica]|uniref:34230_t:CDS:1 n=1 Tax=Racocetra persica TaxID=160502 RepID=A0ACA9MAB8_9GLOM|nr:34230_t:CDS:2 [Racocetra persica]